MGKTPRRRGFEVLESRCLLSGIGALDVTTVAVDIPDDLTGPPGGHIIAPVNIDNAEGIQAAVIRIRYDTTWLDAIDTVPPALTSDSILRGSVWPETNTTVWANVDDAAGTIVAWVFNVDAIATGSGSLIKIDFTVKPGAPIGTTAYLDLQTVSLNEDQIAVDPAPSPWPEGAPFPPPPDPPYSTDGLITIMAANHAPQGADNSLTVLEDHSQVFAAGEFGFSDPNDAPPNALLAVKITTLPGAGTLTNDGVTVTAGQEVSVVDIDAGKLIFTPADDANGNPYASFTFQVRDDGGTANSGQDTDPNPKTMTINVTSVNDAPSGADKTVTTLEDTAYTLAVSDFGFSDPKDTPANVLLAVKIGTVPAAGSLKVAGAAVTAGQCIPVADISAGKLVFHPASNANGVGYASFTFQVQDDGGVVDDGVDLDPTPRTMTVNVTSVNDPPTGADKTVTTLEDTSYTFLASDFGFSDPNDTPPNAFQAVQITALPTAGNLTVNGAAITAGQSVSVADINAGKLVFRPALNANGAAYATFTFQVQDDGGVTNGGSNLDPSPKVMTISVTSINDAPQVTVPGAQNVPVNTDTVVSGISVQDVDAGAEAVQMTLAVLHGKVTIRDSVTGGVPASGITGNGTNQVVLTGSVAQINATLGDAQGLTYRANTDYSGADTLTATANDQGHSGDGGAKTDTKTVSIAVGPMGRLSGFVYADTNTNNKPDANEGVPGVLITLTGGGLSLETWTDDHGWYEFRDLAAGTYQITERQPECMIDGGNNTLSGVVVAATESKIGQNFRERGLKPRYVYNRLCSTTVMPVGSEAWVDAIKQIVKDGEEDAGHTPASPPAVTQQIIQKGTEVTVRGTNGNDSFEFIPGATQDTIILNGESHTFDAATVSKVTFDGGLGKDNAKITGATGKQQIDASPMSGTFQAPSYTVNIYSAEKITGIGGSGGDEAILHDSIADDSLLAQDDMARLSAYFYSIELSNMQRIHAISSAGGQDTLSRVDALDYVLETEGNWFSS